MHTTLTDGGHEQEQTHSHPSEGESLKIQSEGATAPTPQSTAGVEALLDEEGVLTDEEEQETDQGIGAAIAFLVALLTFIVVITGLLFRYMLFHG